jgi:hypothetical protein
MRLKPGSRKRKPPKEAIWVDWGLGSRSSGVGDESGSAIPNSLVGGLFFLDPGFSRGLPLPFEPSDGPVPAAADRSDVQVADRSDVPAADRSGDPG